LVSGTVKLLHHKEEEEEERSKVIRRIAGLI
jgi:hypothetical protein